MWYTETPQQTYKLERGLAFVSTSGHGGGRISKAKAEAELSPEALELVAIDYGNYYYFEEDCDYAVLEYEILTKRPEMFVVIESVFGGSGDMTLESRLKSLLESISYWNREYLIARGIEPVSDKFSMPWQSRNEGITPEKQIQIWQAKHRKLPREGSLK